MGYRTNNVWNMCLAMWYLIRWMEWGGPQVSDKPIGMWIHRENITRMVNDGRKCLWKIINHPKKMEVFDDHDHIMTMDLLEFNKLHMELGPNKKKNAKKMRDLERLLGAGGIQSYPTWLPKMLKKTLLDTMELPIVGSMFLIHRFP